MKQKVQALPTLIIPTGAIRLHDNEQWQMRFEVCSESSSKTYIISQHKQSRYWGCSCPGWKSRRRCKHLDRFGLPGDNQPYEVCDTRQSPAPVALPPGERASKDRIIIFDLDGV